MSNRKHSLDEIATLLGNTTSSELRELVADWRRLVARTTELTARLTEVETLASLSTKVVERAFAERDEARKREARAQSEIDRLVEAVQERDQRPAETSRGGRALYYEPSLVMRIEPLGETAEGEPGEGKPL